MSSLPAFCRDHPWRLRAAALGLAAAVVGLVQVFAPQVLRTVEEISGDVAWRWSASDVPERRVVVVDIDEASLDKHGAWPWPRPPWLRCPSACRRPASPCRRSTSCSTPPGPATTELQEFWRRSPVVLGQIFSLDPADHAAGRHTWWEPWPPRRHGPAVPAPAARLSHPSARGYIGNAGTVISPGSVAGHLTPRRLRRRRRARTAGAHLPPGPRLPQPGAGRTLACGAARWRPASAPDWTWRPGSGLLEPAYVLTSPSLPGIEVPVDAAGNLRMPFRTARDALTSVSAHQVLAGQAPPAVLAGTIALVGATAFGIGDVAATPLAAVAAGVEVHAQLLSGLLDHRVPYTPRLPPSARARPCC